MSSLRVRHDLVFVQKDRIRCISVSVTPTTYGFFVVQVRDALRMGDHVGAMNASRSARSLNITGIVIGCIVIVIVIVAVVVGIVVSVNSCKNSRYSRDC